MVCSYCPCRNRCRARPQHRIFHASTKVIFIYFLICGITQHHCKAHNDKSTRRLRGSESRILSNNAHSMHRYSTNSNERRRLQPGRRGDPAPEKTQQQNDNTKTDNTNTENTGGSGNSGYGDWGSYMSPKTAPTPATPPGPNPQSTPYSYGSPEGASTSTTNSNSAGGYDPSSASSYGSSGSYGGDSGTSGSYGSSSYGSGSGSSSYGGSSGSYGSNGSATKTSTTGSYSSTWGAGETSSGSTWGSSSGSAWGTPSSSSFKGFSNLGATSPKLGLISVVLLSSLFTLTGMLITAHRMEHNPEGNFANCCRVSLHTVTCIYKVIYNLYHCRLGDIPQVVFASELEEEEYTDEEIERMRLRPGIERALDVEHRKALRKVGIEMNKIKPNPTNKKKSGVPRSASMDVR